MCSQPTVGPAARILSNIVSSLLLNSAKEPTKRSMAGPSVCVGVLQAFLGLARVKRLLSQENPSMASKIKGYYFIVFQNT